MSQPSIRDLILASFSCLSVETIDWRMAQKKIRDALIDVHGNEEHYSFCVWSISKGIEEFPLIPVINMQTGEEESSNERDVTARQALRKIYGGNIALLMMNPRKYLSDPTFIQETIDATFAARSLYSHIFFVGPALELPPELSALVYSIDFPLPTKQELIESCINDVVLPNMDRVELQVPKSRELMRSVINQEKDRTGLKGTCNEIYMMNKDIFDSVAKSAQGLDSYSAENAFSLSISTTETLDPAIVQEHKRQAVKRTDVLEFISSADTLDDIGGFQNFKNYLSLRQGAFSEEAKTFGVVPPKGILVVGIPGTGKSLAARATAHALNIPLLRFDMSKVFSMYVGSSESRMRMALSVAEAIAPVCLHLDEIEKAIAGSRSGGDGSGVSARILGQFLQWRAETTAPVFICCTCNDVHAIPPEFYRPGRIDAIFATDLPNKRERAEIFKIHLFKRGKEEDCEDISFNALAAATKGFTGAEIELTVTEAIFVAFNNNCSAVTEDMLIEAASNIVPQSKRNAEEMAEVTKWASERAIPVSLTEKVKLNPEKVRRLVKKGSRR